MLRKKLGQGNVRSNLEATRAIEPLITVGALMTCGRRRGAWRIEWVVGWRMVIGWSGAVCAEMGGTAWPVRGKSWVIAARVIAACVIRGGRARIAAGGGEAVATGIGLWGSTAAWDHVRGHSVQVFLAHCGGIIKGAVLRVARSAAEDRTRLKQKYLHVNRHWCAGHSPATAIVKWGEGQRGTTISDGCRCAIWK